MVSLGSGGIFGHVGGDRGICLTFREGRVPPGCTGEKAEAREVESCENC